MDRWSEPQSATSLWSQLVCSLKTSSSHLPITTLHALVFGKSKSFVREIRIYFATQAQAVNYRQVTNKRHEKQLSLFLEWLLFEAPTSHTHTHKHTIESGAHSGKHCVCVCVVAEEHSFNSPAHLMDPIRSHKRLSDYLITEIR